MLIECVKGIAYFYMGNEKGVAYFENELHKIKYFIVL